ncbi:hypothetical protein FGG08_004781 [Glutinoglossum americanum]|uniref:Uncharacterized protein n=1 Tax=Glutinoglossum americanum TaxID=1670608 RepID=A0A9P8I8I8_9PEZI|nr:hypothetical protein FGG08_004781 [Glutinoglossum americanum]
MISRALVVPPARSAPTIRHRRPLLSSPPAPTTPIVSRPSPPPDPIAPLTLLRACCLRCSKRYQEIPSLACMRPAPGLKCSRCTHLKKSCEEVPASCTAALRSVQRSARRVLRLRLLRNRGIADRRILLKKAVSTLAGRQREYTRAVETVVRGAPSSPEAVDSIAIPMLARLVEQMDQVIGLLRYQAKLPQLPPTPGPPPSGSVEDTEDDNEDPGEEEGGHEEEEEEEEEEEKDEEMEDAGESGEE